MNTIEKTTTTTAQSSTITDNPDGTFDLHGELADRVRAGATASGITPDECANLAIQRGLEIMEERRKKLPIYLPAATVRFLDEVCGAGGITADAFGEGVLGDIVRDSLNGLRIAEELIARTWQHDDKDAVEIAMSAVVARWRS
jgi:hypothetical protein